MPADIDPSQVVLKKVQIVTAALALGAFNFLAITLFITHTSASRLDGLHILTIVGVVLAFVAPGAAKIILNMMLASACRKIAAGTWPADPISMNSNIDVSDDKGKLLTVLSGHAIFNAAAIELPAFFMIIAYQLERQPIALILAVFLIALLLYQIPTRERMESWIEKGLQRVVENRQAGAGKA